MVTGDSTTGTADDAAAARDSAHGVEIRAQQVEDALVEGDAAAGRDVGGRRHDERAVAAVEVAEGRAVEQDLVVQLRREFGAAPAVDDRSPQ